MTLLFYAGFFLPLCTPLSAGCFLFWIWQHPPEASSWAFSSRILKLWGLCILLLVVPAFFASPTPLLHGVGAVGRYGLPVCVWWFLGRRLGKTQDHILLIQGLLWGTVALSAFALSGMMVQMLVDGFGGVRAQGPDMNANVLGAFLALMWPLALWARQQGLFLHHRLQGVLIAGAWWGALLGSGSRNAWLAAGVLWLYTVWQQRDSVRGRTGLLLSGGIGVLGWAFVFLERSLHWHSGPSGWFTGRFTIFSVGLQMWAAYPLTGMGILSVERQYKFWHTGWPQVAHLHNAFLQVAVESGLPAVLCLSLLCFYGIWRALSGNTLQQAIATSWLLLATLSLGDHFLLDIRILMLVTLLAVLVSQSSQS